jgi:hypothetical protein
VIHLFEVKMFGCVTKSRQFIHPEYSGLSKHRNQWKLTRCVRFCRVRLPQTTMNFDNPERERARIKQFDPDPQKTGPIGDSFDEPGLGINVRREAN